ncbi:Na(+)/H(+) antiporter subunit C [Planctomonas psychrotolerans]|uniref:Na(+)/H(+) antiporter subunit C n=1 Tax=Planctomonas psychrotolerans TaxID=2528712 RepID=UPI001238A306|nr:Na(+)/H(+) antiporter subunit C [Planctomonas psychrotolerans]
MSASLVLVAIMAIMYASGVYLMLERSMTRVLVGFMLVGNATNVLILIMAGRRGLAPFYDESISPDEYSDPLPQALLLTAIVITFGASAFLMALIYRSWKLANVDAVQDDAEDLALRGGRGVQGEEPLVPDDDTEFGPYSSSELAAARQHRDTQTDLEDAQDASADDDDDRDFRTRSPRRPRP